MPESIGEGVAIAGSIAEIGGGGIPVETPLVVGQEVIAGGGGGGGGGTKADFPFLVVLGDEQSVL